MWANKNSYIYFERKNELQVEENDLLIKLIFLKKLEMVSHISRLLVSMNIQGWLRQYLKFSFDAKFQHGILPLGNYEAHQEANGKSVFTCPFTVYKLEWNAVRICIHTNMLITHCWNVVHISRERKLWKQMSRHCWLVNEDQSNRV